jgi:hypothetical protein
MLNASAVSATGSRKLKPCPNNSTRGRPDLENPNGPRFDWPQRRPTAQDAPCGHGNGLLKSLPFELRNDRLAEPALGQSDVLLQAGFP